MANTNLTFANDMAEYFFQGMTPTYLQLLSSTGWTSTNWTGSWSAGWTHTVGNTTALTNTAPAVSGNYYTVTITSVSHTAGSFTVSFGGVTSSTYSTSGVYTWSFLAVSAGTLSITPTTDFNGVVFISISNSYYYIALHSADPTSSGTQTSSEVSYTSYARVAVIRTSAGFTATSNVLSNTALVSFPICTGSTATATYFSIGTLNTGPGEVLYSGLLNNVGGLAISSGIQPQFAAGVLSVTLL